MDDSDANAAPGKDPDSIWKAISGRTAKLLALTTVVGGIVAGIAQITGGLRDISKVFTGAPAAPAPVSAAAPAAAPAPTTEAGCVKVDIKVEPTVVSVGNWKTVKFHLTGANSCRETLQVHIAYKAHGDVLRIEPPYPPIDQGPCGYEIRTCWETLTLDPGGDIDLMLTPPKLTRLGPLSEPVKIDINWIIYISETQKVVRSRKVELTVKGGEGT